MSLGMGGIEGWKVVWWTVIGVSVGAVDGATVAKGDPLDGPLLGLNIEGAGSSDSYSAGMDTSVFAFRDERFNEIAGAESPDGFGPR